MLTPHPVAVARGGAAGAFRKARRTRFIHDILSQIEEAIIDGTYRVGDKLPSERELCGLFQTSRGPLREALRVLEQKGLVAIKTGAYGGAFVKAVTTEQISESLGFLLKFKGVTLAELAEFRAFLEGATAALAAKRAKKTDIEHLKALIDEAREHSKRDPRSLNPLLRIDSRFHQTLAQAAGNRLFRSVLKTVYENMYQYQDKYLPRQEKILNLLIKDLSAITAAVELKDAEKARLLMQLHVHKFNRLAEEERRKKMGDDQHG
jgi:GntR family transcriptional regulator, transcriptional repressor for pyruvate dehydrogenase complex